MIPRALVITLRDRARLLWARSLLTLALACRNAGRDIIEELESRYIPRSPFRWPSPAEHWRKCFYCRERIAPREAVEAGEWPAALLATREHVFPRSWVRRLDPQPSMEWCELNRVFACARCNEAKADMHPLAWADMLPTGAGDRVRARVSRLLSASALFTEKTDSLATPSIDRQLL